MTHFGPKNQFSFLNSKQNCCTYKNLNSKFHKRLSLHFQVTNIFLHLCHCVSFIELTRNGQDAQCSYASCYFTCSTTTSHCTVQSSYRVKKSPPAHANKIREHWRRSEQYKIPTAHVMHRLQIQNVSFYYNHRSMSSTMLQIQEAIKEVLWALQS